MTREQMLHAEVASRLAAIGAEHDTEAVFTAIQAVRDQLADLILSSVAELTACPRTDCVCKATAVIYGAISVEIREGVSA